MRARRTVVSLALLAAGVAAGCADGASAPTEAAPAAPRIAMQRTGSIEVLSTKTGDTITDVITLRGDRGGDIRLGGQHWIHFPASAICDPATSGYGPDSWDVPCRPLKGKVTITAVSYADTNGHPRIDFSPELRFIPGNKSNDWVLLAMADSSVMHSSPTILYCGPDSECVDEAVGDATLNTYKSVKHGLVFRRIKHFSGYLITAGRTGIYAF